MNPIDPNSFEINPNSVEFIPDQGIFDPRLDPSPMVPPNPPNGQDHLESPTSTNFFDMLSEAFNSILDFIKGLFSCFYSQTPEETDSTSFDEIDESDETSSTAEVEIEVAHTENEVIYSINLNAFNTLFREIPQLTLNPPEDLSEEQLKFWNENSKAWNNQMQDVVIPALQTILDEQTQATSPMNQVALQRAFNHKANIYIRFRQNNSNHPQVKVATQLITSKLEAIANLHKSE